MDLEYRTLQKAAIHDIHQCFLNAFSDYIVDIRMSEPAFREMHALRAVDYGISIGAFTRKGLVGLTLNGKDHWNGKWTAYDAGTGVIPSFRGQGVSRMIMEKALELLENQGFERYLLEVISSNEKALKLYQSLGFQITRRLECLVLKEPLPPPLAPRQSVVMDATHDQLPILEKAFLVEAKAGFQPSWQNGWNTIRRQPDYYRVVASWDDGHCVGYGVIGAGRGGIAQLWVRSDRRRSGLGSQILRELILRSPGHKTYSWVNVADTASHTLKFLKAKGFTEQLSQFEMEKELHPAAPILDAQVNGLTEVERKQARS